MKESYGEGLASHTGPESCVGVRKGDNEALTGVRAGRVLNREIADPPSGGHSGVPTHIRACGKATSTASRARDAAGPRAVTDPEHVRKHLVRESGEPAVVCGAGPADRIGKSQDTRR
jgi:RNA-directed DNA polymerase